MKKKIAILVILSFMIMIGANALANILPINNITTGEVSDQYPNLFTPHPITFSIWGVIYLLLLLFVFYQARELFKGRGNNYISLLFIISSFINTAWIFAWHYELIFLSLALMIILFAALLLIYLSLSSKKQRTRRERLFIHLPFSVYLGWITVATIANVTAFLVSIGWTGSAFTQSFWAVFVILTATLIGALILKNKRDVFFNLVVIWAFLGIIIERSSSQPLYLSIILAAIGGIAILFITALRLYQKGDLKGKTS